MIKENIKSGQLHFKIGEGLNDLIRNAFWYEGRIEWAKETLCCFSGITNKQIGSLFGDLSYTVVSKANKRFLMKMKKDRKLRRRVDGVLKKLKILTN